MTTRRPKLLPTVALAGTLVGTEIVSYGYERAECLHDSWACLEPRERHVHPEPEPVDGTPRALLVAPAGITSSINLTGIRLRKPFVV